MDAFDRWWHWVNKDLTDDLRNPLTMPASTYNPVVALPETAWHDRERVNEAVRNYRGYFAQQKRCSCR